MRNRGVTFSIARHAHWAPGLSSAEAWANWAQAPELIKDGADPAVQAMPPMLRRRAGLFGKMALEVAYACLGDQTDVPLVFCSRHGEVARAFALLGDLARGEPLSPTAFSMSVHNANIGLLTIARKDRANHIALAAGSASVEHAVIEACGLLADGAPMVLLVACDAPLPAPFLPFCDHDEQAHAWAWLMTAPGDDAIALEWRTAGDGGAAGAPPVALCGDDLPGGLAVARFQLSGAASMARSDGRLHWLWRRTAGSGA